MDYSHAVSEPTDILEHEDADALARKTQGLRAHQEAEDFRWVVSTPQGRRVMWKLLSDAGVFRSVFSGDALVMAYNEGNRVAGLKLLVKLMNDAPKAHEMMMKENANA